MDPTLPISFIIFIIVLAIFVLRGIYLLKEISLRINQSNLSKKFLSFSKNHLLSRILAPETSNAQRHDQPPSYIEAVSNNQQPPTYDSTLNK